MLRSFVNDLAARYKGPEYQLDSRIPLLYLVRFIIFRRVAMIVRGRLFFLFRRNSPFVGSGVIVRCRSRIRMGEGVTIDDNSLIDALSSGGVQIGRRSTLGRNSRIECSGSIRDIGEGFVAGDNVGLGTDCFYGAAGGIVIGSDTIVGNSVSFHSENHVSRRSDVAIREQGVSRLGISVGRDCWIGAKVTFLDGARLGDGCIVAAGAVLTSGFYPGGFIYGGIPARPIRARKDHR